MTREERSESTAEIGNRFVDQIAQLYVLLSYTVEKNVEIEGNQIDILLTYVQPGGISTKTAVECKHLKKGNLQKNSVIENLLALKNLLVSRTIQSAVVVTTNGFSQDVRDAAGSGIQLLTFDQLERNLLDFTPYLNAVVRDFEGDEVSKYYVELAACKKTGEGEKELLDPFREHLDRWLEEEGRNQLSILGEFGTGKTTFSRKLAHDIAQAHLKDHSESRIPILINLKEYNKEVAIESLISDVLGRRHGVRNFNWNAFTRMNDKGMFLLIFDGFDEMALRVDEETTHSNLDEISKLAGQVSKVLLTCRTEYFRNYLKERELLSGETPDDIVIVERPDFEVVYLEPFDDERVKQFLRKRLPLIEGRKEDWTFYYERIRKTYNLMELAQRAVLLDMIAKSLPLLIEQDRPINTANLYKTYIEGELERQIRKKRRKFLIKRGDRITLMSRLAWTMYTKGTLEMHYNEVPRIIQAHYSQMESGKMIPVSHEFLTCSFLSRDSEGFYKFSHRSFLEYFVAERMQKGLKDLDFTDFDTKRVYSEIRGFIRGFLGADEEFVRSMVRTLQSSTDLEERCKAARILGILGITHFQLSAGDLEAAARNGIRLWDVNLTGLGCHKGNLSHIRLSWTPMAASETHTEKRKWPKAKEEVPVQVVDAAAQEIGAEMPAEKVTEGAAPKPIDEEEMEAISEELQKEIKIQGAVLEGADLSACDLSLANLEKLDLRGAKFAGADLSSANVEGSDVADADFRGIKYDLLFLQGLRGTNWRSAILDDDLIAEIEKIPARGARLGSLVSGLGMKFTLVPAGEFLMGGRDYGDEKPVHKVSLTRPFYLGVYSVTQREWKAVIGNNPSHFKGDDLPVESVSWEDCQEFVRRLNGTEGTDKYRLPTEAEWEYACRTGSVGNYCFGNDDEKLAEYAWYSENSGGKTHLVGQKKPNAWGLYDMHGNVWEWCQDWFDDNYYANGPDKNPQGPKTGSFRVYRGGSWSYSARVCRCAFRSYWLPGVRDHDLGLRLARSL